MSLERNVPLRACTVSAARGCRSLTLTRCRGQAVRTTGLQTTDRVTRERWTVRR